MPRAKLATSAASPVTSARTAPLPKLVRRPFTPGLCVLTKSQLLLIPTIWLRFPQRLSPRQYLSRITATGSAYGFSRVLLTVLSFTITIAYGIVMLRSARNDTSSKEPDFNHGIDTFLMSSRNTFRRACSEELTRDFLRALWNYDTA